VKDTQQHSAIQALQASVAHSAVQALQASVGGAHPHTLQQHTAPHYNTLQHTATHCTTLHHTAPHCNTLQHTATHFNAGVAGSGWQGTGNGEQPGQNFSKVSLMLKRPTIDCKADFREFSGELWNPAVERMRVCFVYICV